MRPFFAAILSVVIVSRNSRQHLAWQLNKSIAVCTSDLRDFGVFYSEALSGCYR